MRNLIEESITLISEARHKLMSVNEQYPYLDNIEYEICENVTRTEKLISELKILLKILPNEPKTVSNNEQKGEICSICKRPKELVNRYVCQTEDCANSWE